MHKNHSKKSHICVIDCAIKTPAYVSFNNLVHHFSIPFFYNNIPMHGFDSLKEVPKESIAAYIIFGSYTNVEDRLPWQKELAEMMRKNLEKNIPVLGICFGHQLMADALGGSVTRNADQKFHANIRKVNVINDSLGYKKGEEISLIVSHGYNVNTITDEFLHLATSNDCVHDIVVHKEFPYVGIQGHPEANEYFIKTHFKDNHVNISKELIEKGKRDGLDFIGRFLKFKCGL